MGHVKPLHTTSKQGLVDRHVKKKDNRDADGVGWRMCYRSMEGEQKN